MAGINISKGGRSAFVLMIGDEGAILVQMQKKRVVKRLFAQSSDPTHTRAFNEALSSVPKAPVTILVDMMDQSYVRQTLPPVSSLSVGKIVGRRLDKDFSPDDIKGYIILGREKAGRKDWNYMMAALANPPLLQKWIAFVVERANPFKGIGLIPLEAQPFLVAAEKATLIKEKGKDAKPLTWQILICHHKVGGFRQVVLKDGKLIFTRMAQPIGESVPEVIAGNIEQEMTNTAEYLKRLGLQDTSALSVTIIASEDIKKVIEPKNIKAGEYHFFTPYEMAELLGINDAAQPEDHFGDVVLSAFIAKQRRLLLPMQTPYTKKLHALSLAVIGARATGVAVMLGLIAWAAMNGLDMLSLQQDTEKMASDKATLQSRLTSTKTRVGGLPQQIDVLEDMVAIAKAYNKRLYDPLVFIDSLNTALQQAVMLKDFRWTLNEATSTKEPDKRQLTAVFEVYLAAGESESHEQFIARATNLIDKIKNIFPSFDVTNSELPGILPESKELKTVIGAEATPETTTTLSNSTVKITITGPVDKTARGQRKS